MAYVYQSVYMELALSKELTNSGLQNDGNIMNLRITRLQYSVRSVNCVEEGKPRQGSSAEKT